MKRLFIVFVMILALLFMTSPNPSALELHLVGNSLEEIKANKAYKASEIPVLMYHSISNYAGGFAQLVVSPESFTSQMDYLVENDYTPITFYEIIEYIEGDRGLPLNPIIITFDDGYTDNFTNAFKILKERDMVAVIYPYIKKINTNNGLSKRQFEKLIENEWEIGSHTVNHLDLTTLTKDSLNNEVRDSKQELEEMFDIKVISFCYPAGRYNEKVIKAVSQADYYFGLTTNYGKFKLDNNKLILSRIRINGSDSLSVFAKKIS